MKDKILEEFTVEELENMVYDVNSWNGELDYLEYQVNDEEFFNTYFYNKPDEAVRAVYYGNYNYMDDYVRFNAYGNLESCSELEHKHEIEEYAEDIINAFYNNINDMWNKELIAKVKEFMEVNNEDN